MPGGRPRTPSADEKEEKRKERKRNWATKQRKKERGEEEEKDIDVGKAQRGRPRKAGGTAEEETKRQIERKKSEEEGTRKYACERQTKKAGRRWEVG
ncbi:Hypothetical protein FKW44_009965 [Caligus rogercresseyi]|uniref:Uncharacterized protein n=1 Tax=Caligus rogercresseyi TaxID=217165 RepID=A0A7T8K8N3_CALRO|nr:Hypothetical protein FKW44_009965 [Caligus rogercresseyi]